MKKFTLITLFCTLATGIIAGDGWNEKMTIFKKDNPNNGNYYRIPALTATSQGTLIAVSDYRESGWGDIGTNNGKQKVSFAVKVSYDGGSTWSETQLVKPGANNLGISDPAIVHDSNSGKTFLFGYQNDRFITDKPVSPNSDFYMFTSNDGGKTWDKGQSMKDLTPEGYKYILQGPGSGMSYNGVLYVPIQAWHHESDTATTCTSGFIYSKDNGKTWETAVLRPENYPVGAEGKPDISSESNIFHHNGKVYLAMKPETGRETKKRIVYATSDFGKTWERVEEDFIPDDVAQCESNSLSLSDQVYLVSYTKDKPARRHGLFITTNTGRTIQFQEGKVDGYTSMTQDLDNLYILFEESGDMSMRRYDISSKEYANLNAQILERGQGILDIQDKLMESKNYLSGEYTSENESGVSSVVELNNFKLGAFYKKTKDNSEDVYRTIKYNSEETTLVLSQDNAFVQDDNIFIGYQAGKIKYVNKSKNDLNSFVIGYSFDRDLENELSYRFAVNGVYSNNKVKRNEEEGVGRTADFDSYSVSMKNQLTKDIDFTSKNKLSLIAGLNTTVFGHEDFEEDGGIKTIDSGKWNNAKVDKSKNVSNELYVKATVDQKMKLTDKSNLKLAMDLGWKKELMNVDDWRDEFTVLDVTKEYSTPVKKYDGGVGMAIVSATFNVAEKVELGVGYSIDTTGEGVTTGKVTYKF
ncbi:exo-alpha-sialidase [Fusobacterium sp. SYSU M8A802]